MNQLLAVKGAARDRAMVLLLLRTGMRIGELLNRLVSDVVITSCCLLDTKEAGAMKFGPCMPACLVRRENSSPVQFD